jgi:hypothetical protein
MQVSNRDQLRLCFRALQVPLDPVRQNCPGESSAESRESKKALQRSPSSSYLEIVEQLTRLEKELAHSVTKGQKAAELPSYSGAFLRDSEPESKSFPVERAERESEGNDARGKSSMNAEVSTAPYYEQTVSGEAFAVGHLLNVIRGTPAFSESRHLETSSRPPARKRKQLDRMK